MEATQQQIAMKLAGEAVAVAQADRDAAHYAAMVVMVAEPSAELVAQAREVLQRANANLRLAFQVFHEMQAHAKAAWEATRVSSMGAPFYCATCAVVHWNPCERGAEE